MDGFEDELNRESVNRAEREVDGITSIVHAVAREMWELGFKAGARWCCLFFNINPDELINKNANQNEVMKDDNG